MNLTPYVTRTGTWQDPYEAWFNDPVYNMADNNDDNIPDNPGEILYYVPTRTGQKSTPVSYTHLTLPTIYSV